jgi:UPF0755 protein
MSKKIIAIAALPLIAALLFLYQFSAPQGKSAEERFVVNLNTEQTEIIARLKELGYIRNEWSFSLVMQVRGFTGQIRPGGYMISRGFDVWKLADVLVNHPYQRWVVVPEGLRKEEVADKIAGQLGWPESAREEFVSTAEEGYLFPDTYLFNLDYTGQETAVRMESNFNEQTVDLFKRAAESHILNNTLVILASIIQREAANEKEMPLIAAIIWNRWLNDMKFEIDATVQYVLGKPGNWWPSVTPQDYKIDSPYNTYLHKGRPPAPICNPGMAALNAVVDAEDTDYFFYLHDSQGQIHPAETYEEHLENIEKYLK